MGVRLSMLIKINHHAIYQHFVFFIRNHAGSRAYRHHNGLIGRNIQINGSGNILRNEILGEGFVNICWSTPYVKLNIFGCRKRIIKKKSRISLAPVKIGFQQVKFQDFVHIRFCYHGAEVANGPCSVKCQIGSSPAALHRIARRVRRQILVFLAKGLVANHLLGIVDHGPGSGILQIGGQKTGKKQPRGIR